MQLTNTVEILLDSWGSSGIRHFAMALFAHALDAHPRRFRSVDAPRPWAYGMETNYVADGCPALVSVLSYARASNVDARLASALLKDGNEWMFLPPAVGISEDVERVLNNPTEVYESDQGVQLIHTGFDTFTNLFIGSLNYRKGD